MEFIFTGHALLRIEEREIKKWQIKETILKPDNIVPAKKGRNIALKNFGKRKLKVVYKVENNKFIVITLMWIRRKT